jgi:hypothetical protein
MATIFYVSTDVGNPAHAIDNANSRPITVIDSSGNPLSASFATSASRAISAFSASYALTASGVY